jgi:hypothetical protein
VRQVRRQVGEGCSLVVLRASKARRSGFHTRSACPCLFRSIVSYSLFGQAYMQPAESGGIEPIRQSQSIRSPIRRVGRQGAGRDPGCVPAFKASSSRAIMSQLSPKVRPNAIPPPHAADPAGHPASAAGGSLVGLRNLAGTDAAGRVQRPTRRIGADCSPINRLRPKRSR